ncbi:hypothetical protein SCUCBS95973_000109 [Sporothrix curviconia]|uniref:Uncharacterized protein n=1 Tax=Sporothrix curviconia TaxID=1260050 RepID=A0ABP0AKZ8_9PEZI
MTMRQFWPSKGDKSMSAASFLLASLALFRFPPTCSAAFDGADFNLYDGRNAFLNDPFPAHLGLSPRYFLEGVPAIGRRDDSGCAAGYHSCLDINSTLCCSNDRYCIVDPTTLEAACCSIGLTCGSPCKETQYECNATTTKLLTETKTDLVVSGTATLSLTVPASDVATGAETVVTEVVTTITTVSTYSACCARRCQGTSQFECAASFGGGCCSFGQTCASNSQCFWTSSAASTSPDASATGLVSALPSGCTTSQIACPSSLGGGCCALGHTCTVVSSQIFCASAAGATVSGVVTTTNNGDGGSSLSAGAKAGIALGAVIGAGALIGAAAWVCVRQRRAQRGSIRRDSSLPPPSFGTHEYDDLQQQPRLDPQMHQPMYQDVPGSVAAASTPARSWRRPLYFRRNTASTGFGGIGPANNSSSGGGGGGGGGGGTPGVGGRTPSDSEAISRAGGMPGGGGRLPGLTQDYFGPSAVPGPFTVPGYDIQAVGGNGVGGVPMQPHGPHDIVAPVEIDSTQRMPHPEPGIDAEKAAVAGAPIVQATPQTEPLQPTANEYQHFELYGSDVKPPYNTQQAVSLNNELPVTGSMAVTPGEGAGEAVISPTETGNGHGAAPRRE